MTISLPIITDLESFSSKLGFPKYVLTKYIFNADSYYKSFKIKKHRGHGYRKINSPSAELKGIQRWIYSFILLKIPVHSACIGFMKKKSIKDNARPHRSKEFVLNIDIKNFFPSISIQRITNLFLINGYPPIVAFGLAKLCSFKEKLPQGAPSSPAIANLICALLDKRISKYCNKLDWSYTRYSDDITISGKGNISTKKSTILKIIEEEGFEVNAQKFRVTRRNRPQIVTGLVVNDQINIPRSKRKRIRAIFHKADIEPRLFISRVAELRGYIAYQKMIRGKDSSIIKYERVIKKSKLKINNKFGFALPANEAKARIKINKLLEGAGWRLLDDENGSANVLLDQIVV